MAFSGAACTVSLQADDETSETASRPLGTCREEDPGVCRRDDGEFYLLRVEDVPGVSMTAEPGVSVTAEIGWYFAQEGKSRDDDHPTGPPEVAQTEAPQRPEESRPVDCLCGAAEAAYEALTHPDTQRCIQLTFQQTCDLAKEFCVHTWNVVSFHAEKLCAERRHEALRQRPVAPAAAAASPAADEPSAPAAAAAAVAHPPPMWAWAPSPAEEPPLDALSAASEVLSEELDDEIVSVTDADADELASEFGWNHVQRPDDEIN